MAQVLQLFLEQIKDIIYPNNCAVCGKYIEENENNICNHCFASFEQTWLEDWKDKLKISVGIDEVYSAWFTTGVINDMIHNVKYHNQPKLGMELGRRMAQEFPIEELEQIDLITAVPLNSARIRERGYNQAEWIAKGLSQSWKVPYDFNLLKRIKYTHTQTDLSAEERKTNMKDAFISISNIEPLSIAVVDDVITTGATTSECAKKLKEYGANRITAVSCCTPPFDF